MAPKRKSTDSAEAPGKRANVVTEDLDDEEDEQLGTQAGFTQTQGGAPPCTPDMRERLAKAIARYFLFNEHSKTGIRRHTLRDALMKDVKDRKGRILDYCVAHASEALQETFGLKIQSLAEAIAAPRDDGDQGQGSTQQPNLLAADKDKLKYVLVNQIKAPEGVDLIPVAEDDNYLGLVVVVVGIIRASDHKLQEEKLWEYLAKLGLDKEKSRSARENQPFLNLEEVFKRMVKEGYVATIEEKGKASKEFVEGPRSKLEINVAQLAELEAELAQDSEPTQVTQQTAPQRRGRRSSTG
mmetsp:Transcript_14891/g.40097  ORF Transcript_14891/g.40097 Transcript_14891/m.40097 type:complete len:297 (-) Transcript_14891:218-1108(-)